MYFAKSISDYRIEMFIALINSTLSGYNEYKERINRIISDAKSVCCDPEEIYKIPNEDYSVILFLAENGKDLLSSIDIDSINDTDYQRLVDVLEKKEIIF